MMDDHKPQEVCPEVVAEPEFGEDDLESEEPPWPSSPEEMEADYPEDVAEQADFADDELDLVEPEASPTVAISPVVVPPWRCSLDLLTETPPEIEWLIDSLIPTESSVLFSGREGSLKTWLALEWAYAVAEQAVWLGRECEAGGVLYVDGENPGQVFLSRLHAVGGSRNLNVWRWQDDGFPTGLDDPRLIEASKVHRFIVIDSLMRFMEGLEENSSTDMAKITTGLRQLTRSGATVVALHHATKDSEKPGYRGSTELGAGVDIALTLLKQVKDGLVTLQLTASKTRYAEDPRLTIRVQRTDARPVFHDTSAEAQVAAQAAQTEQLAQLGAVIGERQSALGRSPNQSEVVKAAVEKGLGSRNTILGWLNQGEGTQWKSEPNGRSRVYQPSVHLSNCPEAREEGGLDRFLETGDEPVHLSNGEPVQGVDSLDNRTNPAEADTDLSNPPEGTYVEGFDRMPSESTTSNLSTCPGGIGTGQVDKWTGLSHGVCRAGSYVAFVDSHGAIKGGTVEVAVEWPGYPEELSYIIDGRVVPPSRIQPPRLAVGPP